MWLVDRCGLSTGAKHISCADLGNCVVEFLTVAGLVHVMVEARSSSHHVALEHERFWIDWLLHSSGLEIGLDRHGFIFFVAWGSLQLSILRGVLDHTLFRLNLVLLEHHLILVLERHG